MRREEEIPNQKELENLVSIAFTHNELLAMHILIEKGLIDLVKTKKDSCKTTKDYESLLDIISICLSALDKIAPNIDLEKKDG